MVSGGYMVQRIFEFSSDYGKPSKFDMMNGTPRELMGVIDTTSPNATKNSYKSIFKEPIRFSL